MSDALPTVESEESANGPGLVPWLSRASHKIGIYVAMPTLITLVGFDVFLRYGLNAPLPWGNEVGSLLLLIVFLAGLPYCTQSGGHVRMDLFYGRYGPRAKRHADAVSGLCGLVFAGTLAYQSFASAGRMYRRGDGADMIDLPFWPFAVIMAVSATFLCLQFLLRIAEPFFKPAEGAS